MGKGQGSKPARCHGHSRPLVTIVGSRRLSVQQRSSLLSPGAQIVVKLVKQDKRRICYRGFRIRPGRIRKAQSSKGGEAARALVVRPPEHAVASCPWHPLRNHPLPPGATGRLSRKCRGKHVARNSLRDRPRTRAGGVFAGPRRRASVESPLERNGFQVRTTPGGAGPG